MHRIDGPAALPGGYFTEGDPNVGTPATVVTDDWLNAVQTELETVVTGSGLALSKPDSTQVLQAIHRLIAAAVPPGKVAAFARATAPAGWLVADGSAVSRTAYAGLFAAVGTVFGAGDGSTTFNLPDLRGEFIRGVDGGRGVDSGRVFGSAQADMVERHKHVGGMGEASVRPAPFGRTTGTTYWGTEGSDSDNHLWHTNDGSDFDGAVNAAGLMGSETRPRNVALLLCVKT